MRSKRLMQIFVVFILMLSIVGGSRPALASTNSSVQADAMVINRSLNFWDATYIGLVNGSIHEKWHFDFTATHTFVVSVSPVTGDLVPRLTLFDSSNNQLSSGISSLTSTQSAGSYSVQVEPDAGAGFYILTFREVLQTGPSVTTTVNPTSVNVGETAVITVSLNNVPAEGYTSAEFTCTYNASLVDVGDPVPTTLFGSDPVAVTSSSTGSFIFAIAGSNGNKATTSGTAFTFSATGLSAGQSAMECDARVSMGDNLLTDISSTGASLTVTGSGPTATFTPTPVDTLTPTSTTPVETATPTSVTPVETATPTSSTPDGSPTATSSTPVESPTATSSTPVETATPTSSTPDGSPTATSSTPDGSPTATSSTPVETATPSVTPEFTPTFTSTPLPDGTLSGEVVADKPVTVSLYSGTTLVTSVAANTDGTFSLTAPAGTYTVRATASGFLRAEGPATITSGTTTTKDTVTLLAGDIDNNDVINQFDALTIGMSYNTATPAAADLNNDGVINVLDLERLAENYHESGPIDW